MKADIHPNYSELSVTCSCGNTFQTCSTLQKDELTLDVCSKCHPFYTGQQKIIDTSGRVERFKSRYSMSGLMQSKEKAEDTSKK